MQKQYSWTKWEGKLYGTKGCLQEEPHEEHGYNGIKAL